MHILHPGPRRDWQKLNLSVKNLVKDLKTFDLPLVKILWPSRLSKRYLWLPFFFFCFVAVHIFTRSAAVCTSAPCFYLSTLNTPCTHTCARMFSILLLFCWLACAYSCTNCFVGMRECICMFAFRLFDLWRGQMWRRLSPEWQRGSRKNDGYVCGLITINSPFDCNWCLNLRLPPPHRRPLVPPSILSF